MAVILPATTALHRQANAGRRTNLQRATTLRRRGDRTHRTPTGKATTRETLWRRLGGRGGPPFSAHGGYPRREGYASPRAGHPNAGHLLIGAAIGFGIGATLVGINSARNGTPVGAA